MTRKADKSTVRRQKAKNPATRSNSTEALRHPIWQIIEGGLFHCTPLNNLRAILVSGAIHPNAGQFKDEQPLSRLSCCRKLGGISLFDVPNAEVASYFFSWLKLSGLAIKLDRNRLREHLLDPRKETGVKGIAVPGEMCCLTPIPASCFSGYLLVGPKRPGAFEFLPASATFKDVKAAAGRLVGQAVGRSGCQRLAEGGAQ